METLTILKNSLFELAILLAVLTALFGLPLFVMVQFSRFGFNRLRPLVQRRRQFFLIVFAPHIFAFIWAIRAIFGLYEKNGSDAFSIYFGFIVLPLSLVGSVAALVTLLRDRSR